MRKLLHTMRQAGSVICRLPGDDANWGIFSSPSSTITAYTIAEVVKAVDCLTAGLAAGKYGAGFIAYEAAAAFESAAVTREITDKFPLAWFALYDRPPAAFSPHEPFEEYQLSPSRAELSYQEYTTAMQRIKYELLQGNIYQVNYTFRNRLPSLPEPEQFFLQLFTAHPAPYAAFVNTGP